MYSATGQMTLHEGARVELGVITAPDEAHRAELSAFYLHKGELWLWTVEAPLGGEWGDLEGRFHVAKAGGEIIAAVMTNEYWGVGQLGHVYTLPRWRRQGLSNELVRRAVEDFDRRGGKALYLGTRYGSSAYRIYERHGFRGLASGSGNLVRARGKDVEAALFAPGEARTADAAWRHYPLLTALAATPGGGLRSRLLQGTEASRGLSLFEGAFLGLYRDVLSGRTAMKVLEVPGRCAAGWATLAPRWGDGREGWLLDFHVHPGFAAETGRLVDALPEREGLTYSYVTSEGLDKAAVLVSRGFEVDVELTERQPQEGAITAWGRYVRQQ